MGLYIYFRSIKPMHPALAYELSQRAAELSSQYSWNLCDPPTFQHNSDGHISGLIEPIFVDDGSEIFCDSDDEANLLEVIEILANLSDDHEVDWEFSHDYEPDVVGRIIEGKVSEDLLDEIETVISIGGLFGEFIDDEEWEEEQPSFGVWQAEPVQAHPRIMREPDEPFVIKFPGVE